MSLRDPDLISVQEAREAVERASQAQKKFAVFSQAQVDAVVDACAHAATEAGEQLARLAVEETGYGNVADKIIKNQLASIHVLQAIRGMKTVGIIGEDRERGILEVAEPIGVVAAVIPSTNPTSTAIYKTLISIKARNAIVLSPHPKAMRCICETAGVLERAALRAGAPEGLLVCLNHSTLQGTQELMRHRLTGVILATGGTGLVRAAYSSGKPSYGVGPGNVPAFIERTANVRKAVGDIFAGKTFDYGTICSSEQAIVAEEAVLEKVLEECRQQGGYFLSPEEIERVGALVISPHTWTPNPSIVGRHATVLAELAGIAAPDTTRVLVARLEGVGREFPLSAEKLSPILAFYSAANLAAGIETCRKLLQFGGLGHTCAIHSQSEAAIREFGQKVPAFRVVVNSAAVHGSIGYSTNLFPAMTLGCGAPGGNITSDNIGPQHLMNIKRIAWEARPIEHRTIAAAKKLHGASARPAEIRAKSAAAGAAAGAGVAEGAGVVVPDRRVVANIVEKVMAAHGIPRAAAPHGAANPAVSGPAGAALAQTSRGSGGLATGKPTPAEVAARVVTAAFGAAKTQATAKPASSPQGDARSAGDPAVSAAAPIRGAAIPAAPVKVSDFVCEGDVRTAITQGQKIFIGPRSIVTPSARDLASSHEVLVETQARPAGPARNSPGE